MDLPITTGTLVNIWHGTKGKQYMALGKVKHENRIVLINHNCINNDGKIHAATVARLRDGATPNSIKFVDYESFADGVNVASKISRISGDKVINKKALATFVAEVDLGDITALKTTHNVLADVSVTADLRTSARFV